MSRLHERLLLQLLGLVAVVLVLVLLLVLVLALVLLLHGMLESPTACMLIASSLAASAEFTKGLGLRIGQPPSSLPLRYRLLKACE